MVLKHKPVVSPLYYAPLTITKNIANVPNLYKMVDDFEWAVIPEGLTSL